MSRCKLQRTSKNIKEPKAAKDKLPLLNSLIVSPQDLHSIACAKDVWTHAENDMLQKAMRPHEALRGG